MVYKILGFTVSFNVFQTCDNTFDNTTGVCVSLTGAKIKNCPPLKKLLIERNFAALQKAFCEDPETPSEIPWVQVTSNLDASSGINIL
jgi:hypothetical protein